MCVYFFFFNDTATTEIYTLSLHDALPILSSPTASSWRTSCSRGLRLSISCRSPASRSRRRPSKRSSSTTSSNGMSVSRSEEHTSELQSRQYLVCRLLLEKKKNKLTI